MASKDNNSPNNLPPLPDDKLPECWKQDDRMNSLFADFRNRSVNPQDWSSKYKFWHEVILELLDFSKSCCFSVSDLNIAFKRNGRVPVCLPTVIQEMFRTGEIILEQDFVKEPSSTWTGWAVDVFVKKPLVWSFSKAKNYVSEEVINVHTKYIHLPTVKDLAEIILSTIDHADNNQENNLIPLSEIVENCMRKTENKLITEKNIRFALIWLRNTRKAALKGNCLDLKADLLVKISAHGVKNISEVEEGVYKLKKQESMLIKNIEVLELEKRACVEKAKSYVSTEFRHAAKNCLRKKHEIEKCIEKRGASLRNVQTLLSRIHDAHSDAEVLDVYKVGCNILKKFEETGLTEDNVRDTMDNLSDVLEEMKDVQSVLAEPSLRDNESDTSLEKELEDLLNSSFGDTEKEKSFEAKDTSINAPDLKDLPDLSSLNLLDLPAPKKPTQLLPTV
ncbi:charged multivesicular body protein 7 [Leptopilina heterotoma]|uniref:charged multivesicular body protein 7 n=1 Tax=Leptopilina heterotoma TaxID=63436 RepID=UPI001CA93564|nr:charged multivesicular body protein 7 [Leptopilina heterotoma]